MAPFLPPKIVIEGIVQRPDASGSIEKHLLKLDELGTFSTSLTGGDSLLLKNLLTTFFYGDQARVV